MTKYTPNYEYTVKLHMHAHQSNIRSTKNPLVNNNMETTIPTPNCIHIITKNEESYDDTPRKIQQQSQLLILLRHFEIM